MQFASSIFLPIAICTKRSLIAITKMNVWYTCKNLNCIKKVNCFIQIRCRGKRSNLFLLDYFAYNVVLIYLTRMGKMRLLREKIDRWKSHCNLCFEQIFSQVSDYSRTEFYESQHYGNLVMSNSSSVLKYHRRDIALSRVYSWILRSKFYLSIF